MSGVTGINFIPNSAIRPSEVNQNFEWFRGHYLPITQSGTWANTNNASDLGSAAAKWRDGYFSGSITAGGYNTTGGGEALRMIRGVIDGSNGSITSGAGFTCSRGGTGVYTISATTSFLVGTDASCVVTHAGSSATFTEVNASIVNSSWTVRQRNTANVATDCGFHFIIIGQP